MERLRNERFKAEIACIWDNAKASEARAVSVSLTEFPLSKSAPAARAHQVDVETTWPSAKKKKKQLLADGASQMHPNCGPMWQATAWFERCALPQTLGSRLGEQFGHWTGSLLIDCLSHTLDLILRRRCRRLILLLLRKIPRGRRLLLKRDNRDMALTVLASFLHCRFLM